MYSVECVKTRGPGTRHDTTRSTVASQPGTWRLAAPLAVAATAMPLSVRALLTAHCSLSLLTAPCAMRTARGCASGHLWRRRKHNMTASFSLVSHRALYGCPAQGGLAPPSIHSPGSTSEHLHFERTSRPCPMSSRAPSASTVCMQTQSLKAQASCVMCTAAVGCVDLDLSAG